MLSLWKFAGLTLPQLTQRAATKIREDEIFTRSSSLAYYFLLSLFPMLLFLLSLLGILAGPHSELKEAIVTMLGRLAPGSATGLIRDVLEQTVQSSGTLKVGAGIVAALWAASGGVGALIESLNVINRVKETRSWLKLRWLSVALTVGLAALIILAVALILYGGKIGDLMADGLGLGGVFRVVWRVLQWVVPVTSMFLSFCVIFYFGPDLEERKWYWLTPGAAVGVCLWLLASLGFRVYLHFFDSYSATYGFIGAVIILMLWLYFTGIAILVGAEVNSVIEMADASNEKQVGEKSTIKGHPQAA